MTVPSGVLSDLLDAPSTAPALWAPEDERPLSYGDLEIAIDELATCLASLGVAYRDRVALVLPPGPEFVQLLLAIASLGAAAAPLNPSYGEPEFSFYLDDLEPRAILLPEGELEAARRAAPTQMAVIDVAPALSAVPRLTVTRGKRSRAAPHEPEPEDVALLLHTSGTTSRPKQVPLRHRNLFASADSMARHYQLSADDSSYCAMPLFHVHGLVASTLAQLRAGGTVIIPRRVGAARFWTQVADCGATWYSASPTLHQMFLERAPKTRPDHLRLRFARSCSSALSSALATRAENYLDIPMLEAYGMTEASHEMSANPLPPGSRVPGSVGIPTGADIRIVDSTGAPLGEASIGEVVVRGPGVTSGYYANEEANAQSFYGEWFRTGDQGRMDDGYLTLVGRLKEIIIRGGENISPLEVESVLMGHSAVSEAVVYGIPDDKYGQVVGAAVLTTETTTEAELISYCKSQLAAFKVPSTVHVVDSIPRTPTGKVQRRRMAAYFGED